ncbi:MAG: dockerin type I domain-containing protein [bacterium]
MISRQVAVAALLLLISGSALGYGVGGGCVHVSNPFFGPDTIAIGQWNRFEIWIDNDAPLTGMVWSIGIDLGANIVFWQDTLTQGVAHLDQPGADGNPDIIDYGRALGDFLDGSCWTQSGFKAAFNSFDGAGFEDLLIGGAVAWGPGFLAGPSELCYSLNFYVSEAGMPADTAINVRPYYFPPGDLIFVDTHGGYPPDFCGEPMSSPSDPMPEPISFPSAVPRPRPCGDIDYNSVVNIADLVALVNYIFNNGPRPQPIMAADFDCDTDVFLQDLVAIIRYIFLGGPGPCEDCVDYGAPPE